MKKIIKNQRKSILTAAVLLMGVILIVFSSKNTSAAKVKPAKLPAKQHIKVDEFFDYMGKKFKIKKEGDKTYRDYITEDNPYFYAGVPDGKGTVTNEIAGYLLYGAYFYYYPDETDDDSMYHFVDYYKRVHDIKKAKYKYREAIKHIFGYGIMAGYSKGRYTHSRDFRPKKKITKDEMKLYVARLMDKKKRVPMSRDGQVLRTKNLPKKAKYYEYILESFPNKYYDRRWAFEVWEGVKKKGIDIIYPKDYRFDDGSMGEGYMKRVFDASSDMWIKKATDNMMMRFNVDYRTIKKDKKWYRKLYHSYYVFEDGRSAGQEKAIKPYIKQVIKNKVRIVGKVDTDKSSIYQSIGAMVIRFHVKFKVISAKDMNPEKIFYSEMGKVGIVMKPIKKGVWYDRIYEVELGSPVMCDFQDHAVHTDELVDWDWYDKTVLGK
ncbi:MAG: S-layer homology domain-containing protein [Lachnospiraceae bacterium]|nr:S-layer homology domain-containing protein [Lachnospiraceae bacterium]